MNQKLFSKLYEKRPSQHTPEWRMFMEVCDAYLKRLGIKNPIAVELGTWNNRQKPFYEQLLGAHHIGIDIRATRGMPDIVGDTHKPATVNKLKKMLGGKPIDILFIDACHRYKSVKKDFELYSPLCNGIVGFHDIHTRRDGLRGDRIEVWRFWDELESSALAGKKHTESLFLSIYQHRYGRRKVKLRAQPMGIGVMIKR